MNAKIKTELSCMAAQPKKGLKHVMMMTVCVLGLALTGCASSQQDALEVYDPLEGVNRATFAFNDALDRAVAQPVARGYRAVVPKPARTGVHNFLTNLKSPVNIGNQVLQGDVRGAANDVTRALVNTVFGIGGLIDIASDVGLEKEQEDFGQTLAVWGVDSGPYLVLPLLGPSNARDAVGGLVDAYADPLRIYLDNIDEEEWSYVRMGVSAISQRERLLDTLDDLRRNSFDYYVAIRSSYTQRRAALIRDENPDNSYSADIPDYDY